MKPSYLVAFVATFVLLAGCGNERAAVTPTKARSEMAAAIKNSSREFDDIAKVSLAAALLKMDIATRQLNNCMLSEALAEQKPSKIGDSIPPSNQPKSFMVDMWKESAAVCDVLKRVDGATKDVFKGIGSSKSVPSILYVFSLFLSSEQGEHFDKVQAGLFATMEDCTGIERMAREAGLGTRVCEKWADDLLK